MRKNEAIEFARLFVHPPEEHDPSPGPRPPNQQVRRTCQNRIRKDFRLNVSSEAPSESPDECCRQGLTGGEIWDSILTVLDVVQAGEGPVATAPVDEHRFA